MGAPTIADVAREANCSPMTVSRVINSEGNVRDEKREQVLAAIARLNYSPNRAARSLAGGEQTRMALLFDNPSASSQPPQGRSCATFRWAASRASSCHHPCATTRT
jgi:DNA-binding LacI/PurR family transcriptional regulator